jgi:hypothetical protein
MSEIEKRNRTFYGEDERPPLYAVLQNLYALTKDHDCARELVEASDYVEQVCDGAALTPMPKWVC